MIDVNELRENLVGLCLEDAKEYLSHNGISFAIKENNSTKQKVFDKVIVVNVQENTSGVVLVVSNFLVNIKEQ